MQIKQELFGRLLDGRTVTRYTLQRDQMKLCVLDFGAAIQQLWLPDKDGCMDDVVCGFDHAEYYDADTYQGVIVGRYANRIAGARFCLDGTEYRLSANRGGNHLHGGFCGFQRRFWHLAALDEGEEPAISLSLHSPHGDEGYPGNLDITVTYRLLSGNALSVHFEAVCDQKTVLNPITHVAFQLGGLSEGNIYDHLLWLDTDCYLPVKNLLPTGEMRLVRGTVFDFNTPKKIGRDIHASILQNTKGYDVCMRFAPRDGKGPWHRATLLHERSGREMKMYTDLPALQLYCGNYYGDPTKPFKGNVPQRVHHGVCLEAGMMLDSPNHTNFTKTTLAPGERFDHRILYCFSTKTT